MNRYYHVTPTPFDEYRRRRDFSKTPELVGQVKHANQPNCSSPPPGLPRPPELLFCVKSPLASQSHYDLRLERSVSWCRGRYQRARRLTRLTSGWPFLPKAILSINTRSKG